MYEKASNAKSAYNRELTSHYKSARADVLEAGLVKASEETQACFSRLGSQIRESAEKATSRLEQLQRSQIYLEQKLMQEISATKAGLQEHTHRADDRLSTLEAQAR